MKEKKEKLSIFSLCKEIKQKKIPIFFLAFDLKSLYFPAIIRLEENKIVLSVGFYFVTILVATKIFFFSFIFLHFPSHSTNLLSYIHLGAFPLQILDKKKISTNIKNEVRWKNARIKALEMLNRYLVLYLALCNRNVLDAFHCHRPSDTL
jgi:hypothetical protein